MHVDLIGREAGRSGPMTVLWHALAEQARATHGRAGGVAGATPVKVVSATE